MNKQSIKKKKMCNDIFKIINAHGKRSNNFEMRF